MANTNPKLKAMAAQCAPPLSCCPKMGLSILAHSTKVTTTLTNFDLDPRTALNKSIIYLGAYRLDDGRPGVGVPFAENAAGPQRNCC